MQTVPQLLDTVKKKHGLTSDYKLALFLGLREQSIGNYRHGKTLPDAAACSKIAAALDMDAGLLLVQIESQRAKTDEARNLWANLAQRLQMGTVNLSVLLAAAILFVALLSPLETHAKPVTEMTEGGLYIMLII